MSCYKPITAWRTPTGIVFNELSRHDIRGRLDIPCNKCIGCRLRRASDWASRISHEQKLHEQNCFITLTYAPEHIPPGHSLDYKHFQDFLKRLRAKYETPIRFYMCGEYGDETERPHYHACIFGLDFNDRQPAGKGSSGELFYDSEELTKIWGKGKVSVQDLTPETAGYCARYIVDKLDGDMGEKQYRYTDENTGEQKQKTPPFAKMSLKPGIGARWLNKYRKDVYQHDQLITSKGETKRPPVYYDKLQKKHNIEQWEATAHQRELRARAAHQDNTTERLKAKEHVQLAKIQTLKRNLK